MYGHERRAEQGVDAARLRSALPIMRATQSLSPPRISGIAAKRPSFIFTPHTRGARFRPARPTSIARPVRGRCRARKLPGIPTARARVGEDAVRKAVVRIASRKHRVANRWNLGGSQVAAPVAHGTPARAASRCRRSAAHTPARRRSRRHSRRDSAALRRALAARPSSSPASSACSGAAAVAPGGHFFADARREMRRAVAEVDDAFDVAACRSRRSRTTDRARSGSGGPCRSGSRRSRAPALRLRHRARRCRRSRRRRCPSTLPFQLAGSR